MMNESKTILVIVSRSLDYPDDDFFEEQERILSFIRENIQTDHIQRIVFERINSLYKLPLKNLQELYVNTFDHSDKTNLYLTAHEVGDSKTRGMALIQLQKLITESGFTCLGTNLADYIPMLLELAAVIPEDEIYDKLTRRLSYAINRIVLHLPDENPYKKVMELVMMFVFKIPRKEEMSALERLREQADLDELPYPLMYR